MPSGTPAYVAAAPEARRGVVVIPDIAGLRPLFTELCDRLRDQHRWSVAVFEPWPGREDLDLEARLAAVGSLDDDRLVADVAATADALAVEPVAVMGFCMGGMFALKTAASGRVDRAVSFYGMVRLPAHWRSATVAEPLEVLRAAPASAILSVVGTEDAWVPGDDADALEAIGGAEVVRYDGADHGFVHDPSRPAHRPADAADAWRRVAEFLTVEPA